MREIKFRAWDIDHKYMLFVGGIDWDRSKLWGARPNDYEYRLRDFILMQSTGIKDKQGKDLFEGDIVRYDTEDGIVTAEVIFKESTDEDLWISGFAFRSIGIAEIEDILVVNELEIIGNIYENSELLKGK